MEMRLANPLFTIPIYSHLKIPEKAMQRIYLEQEAAESIILSFKLENQCNEKARQ